ncbi:methyltransferase [Rhizomicrobium palustre]|uniref:Methyltransferase n=1 Tax=Rhizomicrobium palustre TaxID=189966 RepID=A0A846N2P5_9PROT|nr:isoprenylcysteine carboxylmethyltransferase family protein [Rhizomicrobium palustre]NIK89397.1 methyltransferase [Rhizomicrobium palustre]
MTIAIAIIAAVALQRLLELVWAQRNTARLRARGATEVGASHYPLIVLLHAAWLVSILIFLPLPVAISAVPLAAFLGLQLCRVWVLFTLGPYFTTRIISLPGAPLVRKGPYRYIRHPNYAVVIGEILTLPLVFGEVKVAIVFSLLNAAILTWRIRVEDAALAARR